jgi:hypothetical protein
MNKYILPATLLGLGLLAMSKKGAAATTTTTTTTNTNPIITIEPEFDVTTTNVAHDLELPGHTVGSTGEIDYRRWLRKEWSAYLRSLIEQLGAPAAIDKVWADWYAPVNKMRNIFPMKAAFIFNLATYNPLSVIGTGFNIEWNSSPVYHSGIWSGAPHWDCEDWKTWHIKLEQHYHSTALANQTWEAAWRDDRNWTQESSTLYWLLPSGVLPSTANCPTDGYCWFIEYFYSKGINLATSLGGTSCNLQNIGQNIVQAATNLSAGINNTSKVISWGLPIGLAAAIYFYVKKSSK